MNEEQIKEFRKAVFETLTKEEIIDILVSKERAIAEIAQQLQQISQKLDEIALVLSET